MTSDKHPRYIIEYGHIYLKKIESNEFEDHLKKKSKRNSQFDHLREVIDLFETEDISYDLIVTIDDTSSRYADQFGSPSFVTFRNKLAKKYINHLPVKPDGYYFESRFGGILSKLIGMFPQLKAGELGRPDKWGLLRSETGESLYVYGPNEPGERKPKIKIIDRSEDTNKATPYTCSAYDTAMSLSKFGLIGGPAEFIAYPHAISLHNNSFYRSQPFRKSTLFQRILFEQDIVPIKTYTPPRHLEVGPSEGFDTIRSFVMECKHSYADLGIPEHEHLLPNDEW